MNKFILTESEKNRIRSLYRTKGVVLSEQESESFLSNSKCKDLVKDVNVEQIRSGKIVLKKGMQGKSVELIQCLLNQANEILSLGLEDLVEDGKFGSLTKEMTIKFQESQEGLKNDGIVGKNTFRKLSQVSPSNNQESGDSSETAADSTSAETTAAAETEKEKAPTDNVPQGPPTAEEFLTELRVYWGTDFIEGTTTSIIRKNGVYYYKAVEPNGKKYYFLYAPEGNKKYRDFHFQEFKRGANPVTPQTQASVEEKKKEVVKTESGKKFTTDLAISAKTESIRILEGLLKQVDRGTIGDEKRIKWETSLAEIKSTPDSELCTEENKAKVEAARIDAEKNMKNPAKRIMLNKFEKEECQKLIDGLAKYPEYCKGV